MNRDVLQLLRCPACGNRELSCSVFREDVEGKILDGVVWCKVCHTWYPIEDGLLELLAGDLAYRNDRARFWVNYSDRLRALGLGADEDVPERAENELQIKQQAHFDWYANNEEQTYSEYEQMSFWLAADTIAYELWRQEMRPGKWLLDVGCGQGRSTFKVMDLALGIVAFDVSKRMIRQAIDRYREGNYSAKTTFLAADASRFPFVDTSFDYVLIYGVLHHLPDPASTCQEVARVLKSGGIYFGQENNRSAFRAVFDLLQKLNPIWHEEAGPEALISARNLERWFEGTGMRIASQTSIFLPPHLINLAGEKIGYGLLKMTDRVGKATPFLRDNGGIRLIRGVKS